MTLAEARRIVALIAARYPGAALADETLALWAELLVDLDADLARAVALDYFRAHDERLDPALLRRLVAERQAAVAQLGWLPVEDAWREITGRITAIGRNRDFATATSVKFPTPPPPFLARIVERLGWETLCNTTADDLATVTLGPFRRLYGEALARALGDAAANPGALPDPARSQPGPSLPPPEAPPVETGPTRISGVLADLTRAGPRGTGRP